MKCDMGGCEHSGVGAALSFAHIFEEEVGMCYSNAYEFAIDTDVIDDKLHGIMMA